MVRISLWTVGLLVLLRLAIGWHFFFEGYQKIRSHNIGTTETNKPWTAEGYYRVAEGPARTALISQFGDPDQETLDRLRLLAPDKDKGEIVPERTPVAIAVEWNDYLTRFGAFFKLNNDEKEAARLRVEEVKKKFVEWLVKGTKTIKRNSPTGGAPAEVSISIPERVLEYEFKLRELRDIFDKRLVALGRDVEKKVPQMRGEIAVLRNELLVDIADYTTKVKNTLADFLQNRFSGFNAKSGDTDIDAKLLRMLKPRKTEEIKFGEEKDAMPATLGGQWDEYLAFVKEFHPKFDETEATRRLDESKRRYVRYLLDRDEFSDRPRPTAEVTRRLKEYEDAEAKLAKLSDELKNAKDLTPEKTSELNLARESVKQLRDPFLADIQRHTDGMKSLVGEGLPADIAKGFVPEEKKTSWLQRADQITMWLITVSGICLLLGFFTRLACIVAASFLILTYLAHPAFPWLPASPMNEGNYVFVNKNVIEALALLMLATTQSGKWLGLDAWITRLFQRRR